MITGRNIFLLFIGLAVVLMLGTYVSRCSRAKPVTKHQANREQILKADSLKSEIDTRYRAKLDSLKYAYQDTLKHARENYRVIVQKDVRIEYRYHKAPSLAACDSVVDSKNSRIGMIESMAHQQDQVSRANDSLLASYAGSIQAKDKTIHQLNAGYEQAIQDLQKAKKPRRFGLGLQAGYGVGPSLRPGPVVSLGLSYNFARF